MNANAVFSKLLASYYPKMTASEQRIADYLIRNPHEAVRLTVTSLAKAADTSEATIVRFARSLGFSGFLELKAELQLRASQQLAGPVKKKATSAPVGETKLLAMMVDQEIVNLQKTLEELDWKQFQSARTMLEHADIVYTLGSGASSHLALAASYHVALNRKRSINLNQTAVGYDEQLLCADPKRDLLWVFSFPPYSSQVLSSIELAANRGIKTLAITDSCLSPVSEKADHVLFAANGSIVPSNSQTSAQLLIKALLLRDDAL
ncbi:MAG: MurR/RpiR family transcriptional regulator [Oligoflexus sp.]|jgi:DNA-binding MurR/RpiR family transcriptional regulator